MALSANTVWEVRNTADYAGASDSNGGGFVAGASGTDYSFASLPSGGAPHATGTNLTVDGTTNTKVNPDGYTVAATDVGNLINITTTGTGAAFTTGRYQITAVTTGTSSTQRWTLDRSPAAVSSAGASWNLGGCLATPGAAAAAATVTGQIIYVKYSTSSYTLTTATPGAAGPVVVTPAVVMQGYDQSRGDFTGNRPVLNWGSVSAPGANTYLYTSSSATRGALVNLAANGNNVAKVCGFEFTASRTGAYQCVASNCSGSGCFGFESTSGSGNTSVLQCQANNCATGFDSLTTHFCEAVSCTVGFNTPSTRCLASACGTGFNVGNGVLSSNCLADSCTTVGFTGSGSGETFANCLASNCAIGFTVTAGQVWLINCALYNNTTGISGTPQINVGQVTLTQQPFVSAGSDFRANTTAGGGASLRAAAIGVFGQVDNVDVGAVQHSDPSAGPTGFVMTVRPPRVVVY